METAFAPRERGLDYRSRLASLRSRGWYRAPYLGRADHALRWSGAACARIRSGGRGDLLRWFNRRQSDGASGPEPHAWDRHEGIVYAHLASLYLGYGYE